MFVQIKEYPDYMVDENGTVVSLKGGKWKVLKAHEDSNGYLRIELSSEGNARKRFVHRLVSETFLGSSKLQINHKNGKKTDNRLENLEYCTPSENIRHAWSNGLSKSSSKQKEAARLHGTGEKNNSSKLTDQQAAQLLALKGTMFQREAAELFGVSVAQVSNIWTGKQRKHLQTKVTT